MMGAAAVSGSDLVIVTSDNPRTEDPLAIIGEIEGGMTAWGSGSHRLRKRCRPLPAKTPYLIIPDRHEAIEHGDQACRARATWSCLPARGTRITRSSASTKHHFDDREVAREAITKRKQDAECGTQQCGLRSNADRDTACDLYPASR